MALRIVLQLCLLMVIAATETYAFEQSHVNSRNRKPAIAVNNPTSMQQRMDWLDQKFSLDMALMKQDLLAEKIKRMELESKLAVLEQKVVVSDNSTSNTADQVVQIGNAENPHIDNVVKHQQIIMKALITEKLRRKRSERIISELQETVRNISALVKQMNEYQGYTHSELSTLIQRNISQMNNSFEGQKIKLEFVGDMIDILKIKTENTQTHVNEFESRTRRLVDDVRNLIEKYVQISELQTNIVDMNRKVTDITEMYAELQQHNSNRRVAFYAQLNKIYHDIAPWETVVFGGVSLNEGGGYSATSGEFVAPLHGVYVFNVHIVTLYGRTLEAILQVNGHGVMLVYSKVTDSNMVIVSLNAGDVVKVAKHGIYGEKPFYIHHYWSTFSGFMLF